MKKSAKKLVSCLLTMALATTAITVPQDTNTVMAASVTTLTTSPARVSVHDPSITETIDGYYYAFGSHISAAKSKDLVNWTSFTNGYATKNNAIFGDLAENLKKPSSGPASRAIQMMVPIMSGHRTYSGIKIMSIKTVLPVHT